eukprot:1160385-Pelagomonas_calceolata.AAC.9
MHAVQQQACAPPAGLPHLPFVAFCRHHAAQTGYECCCSRCLCWRLRRGSQPSRRNRDVAVMSTYLTAWHMFVGRLALNTAAATLLTPTHRPTLKVAAALKVA